VVPPAAGRVTVNRVALALAGQQRRKAAILYGEVLAFLAETPHSEGSSATPSCGSSTISTGRGAPGARGHAPFKFNWLPRQVPA
jgi:hypothetical protein